MEDLSEDQLLVPLSMLFGQKIAKFPGTLPVTIDSDNSQELRHGFVAALKANGTRCYCFVEANKLRLMNRKKQFMTFELEHTFENDYVFDCEYDAQLKMLLLFDTLLFNNRASLREDYLVRIRLACYFLAHVVPKTECKHFPKSIVQNPAPLPMGFDFARCWRTPHFVVQVKPTYRGEDAATLWHNRHLAHHPSDGIVFTRLWCAYRPFSDPTISVMKWKPHSTIDFLVEKLRPHANRFIPNEVYNPQFDLFHHPSNEQDCNVALLVLVDNKLLPFSFAKLPHALVVLCHTRVCEFQWDDTHDIFVWQMIREDKTTPNSLHTAVSCVRSTADNIQIEDLMPFFNVDTTQQPKQRRESESCEDETSH